MSNNAYVRARFFQERKSEKMLMELSEAFTRFIFEYLGIDESQEIKLEEIKQLILDEADGWELFCLFCGADT
jgi:hypothetical protein